MTFNINSQTFSIIINDTACYPVRDLQLTNEVAIKLQIELHYHLEIAAEIHSELPSIDHS